MCLRMIVVLFLLGCVTQAHVYKKTYASPKLEKVLILQRHGVRAPTKPTSTLSQYSQQPWHPWPVNPGELTPHGAEGAEAMGAYVKAYYSVTIGDDDERYFVWSDSGDTRTVASGKAVARALRRDGQENHAAEETDILFSPDDRGLCPPPTEILRQSLSDRGITSQLRLPQKTYDKAREAMAKLLHPGISAQSCDGKASGTCLLINGKNTVTGEGWNLRVEGPLATGSTLSENLLLEYSQNFSNPGWGRITPQALRTIMPLHNIYTTLMRRNPVIASRKGALLAQTITDVLSATPSRFAGAPPLPEQARVIVFLGHDSNLSNLAGIYRLDWKLIGQPDDTAPNTALAFELWRGKDGGRFVRLRLFYQTLAQLRQNGPSSRARSITLTIPQCVSGPENSCPLDQFVRLTASHIEKSCLKPMAADARNNP